MVCPPSFPATCTRPRRWLLLLVPLAAACTEAAPTDPIADATSPTYVIAHVTPAQVDRPTGAALAAPSLNRVGTASAHGGVHLGPIRAYHLPPGHFSGLEGVALKVRFRAGGTNYWGWTIDWGDGFETITLLDLRGEFVFLRTQPYPAPGTYTITAVAIDAAIGTIGNTVSTTVTIPG